MATPLSTITPAPTPTVSIKQVETAWDIQIVDSDADSWSSVSLALDTEGSPHISYIIDSGSLGYARWTGSTWEIQVVDDRVGVNSLALDAANRPHISYFDATSGNLKYAVWTGDGWHIQIVGSAEEMGGFNSLALDALDYPHINYYNLDWEKSKVNLKYAHWTGDGWNIQTIDDDGLVGWSNSLALDASDHPHIGYASNVCGNLMYARWTGNAWDVQTVDRDGYVFYVVSLALDSTGKPHISYHTTPEGVLRYAHWTGSSWAIQTIDGGARINRDPCLAVDAFDHPHISFSDLSDRDDDKSLLKYARWTGGAWEVQIVDDRDGWHSSLALDPAGVPHISYVDPVNGGLKYARPVPTSMPDSQGQETFP